MSLQFTILEEAELVEVTSQIVENLTHKVILLIGEMGAGKTTFSKYLVKQLIGYDKANSPTFSLINEYRHKESDPVYHMDLYRLESIEEALNIGIEEYLYSGHINIIEWPQLIESILPEDCHVIDITLNSALERTISFS